MAKKNHKIKNVHLNLKQLSTYREIDLHFESNERTISIEDKGAILRKQLSKFKAELQYCYNNNVPKLVVVHGVGEGVLKGEILKILRSEIGLTYQDANYLKYGDGATEIIF